jgi:type IV pilus assembly protein PilV
MNILPVPADGKGLTLIEALMAIVIMSIGLLAVGTLLYSIMGYNQYAETVTTATTLAQDELEALKAADYADIPVGTVSETDIDGNGNSGGIYTRSTDVAVDNTTLPGKEYKIVTVTVTWSWNGRAQNVALKTILRD